LRISRTRVLATTRSDAAAVSSVLRGPFARREAVVTWSSAERCRLVWLLNRDVVVTLSVADVLPVQGQ